MSGRLISQHSMRIVLPHNQQSMDKEEYSQPKEVQDSIKFIQAFVWAKYFFYPPT